MNPITYADLYAIQSQAKGEDWENRKVYFTDKLPFLLAQLEAESQRVQGDDKRFRILCLSSNQTLHEAVYPIGKGDTGEA